MSTTTLKPARRRVEKAGDPSGNYLRGWLAMSSENVGIYVPTFAEAINYATREADAEYSRHLLHMAGMGAAAAERILMADVHASRSNRREAARA